MPKYAGTGFCQECGEEVEVYYVDEGIGVYEYWGAKCVDHNWQPECGQCGSYMEEFTEYGEIDDYDRRDR